jgi:predicted nucleotidyltransferase
VQKKSLDSLKNTLVELDFRSDWIPEFIRYIERCIQKGAVFILLFGSRAKREFLKDSDIDLLIVSPELPGVRERALLFFSDSLPVQPFVITSSELEERIARLDFLVFDAFEDGVVLFSEIDMKHVHDMLKASKERFRLVRVKDGWMFDADAAEEVGI